MAGIVFYPRYFEMIASVIERFFEDELGYGFVTSQEQTNMSTPMGEISTRFCAPSRLGDILQLKLHVQRVGRSSASFEIRYSCEDQLRFKTEATVAHANPDAGVSACWPKCIREALLNYQQ